MSSKRYAAVVLFLSLNLLFISLATAKTTCSCSNPPSHKPKPTPPPHSKPKPTPPPHSKPKPTPPPHSKPKPTPPPHKKPKPTPCPPPTPTPKPTPPSTPPPTPKPTPPSTPPPTPKPTPPPTLSPPTPMPTPPSTPPTPMPTPPTPPSSDSCPIDTLKLGVCGDLLGGLVNIVVGTPPNSQPCCSLIQGITDLDAAVCLCTALKANVLGINLNVPISLSLLLNTCGKNAPSGFQCRSS